MSLFIGDFQFKVTGGHVVGELESLVINAGYREFGFIGRTVRRIFNGFRFEREVFNFRKVGAVVRRRNSQRVFGAETDHNVVILVKRNGHRRKRSFFAEVDDQAKRRIGVCLCGVGILECNDVGVIRTPSKRFLFTIVTVKEFVERACVF